jgi:hypothetical protein
MQLFGLINKSKNGEEKLENFLLECNGNSIRCIANTKALENEGGGGREGWGVAHCTNILIFGRLYNA